MGIITLFCACASVSVKEEDPMALWGADAKVFDGRVYSAYSKSRSKAIKEIAKVAKKQGYNYFTLLQDSSHISRVKSGSFGNLNLNAYANNNNAYANAMNNSFSYSTP